MDRTLIKQGDEAACLSVFYFSKKSFQIFFWKGNSMIIVTNNPSVREYFKAGEVDFVDSDYKQVLLRVRDYVHKNHTLLTHPLSGSVKPNETPYKSIALEAGKTIDFASLELIENALAVYDKFQGNEETPQWTQRVKEDFMVIDFDLIKNALKK